MDTLQGVVSKLALQAVDVAKKQATHAAHYPPAPYNPLGHEGSLLTGTLIIPWVI